LKCTVYISFLSHNGCVTVLLYWFCLQAEQFNGTVIFIDQKEGKLFSYDGDAITEIYDVSVDALPSGVDVDGINRPAIGFNDGSKKKIQSVAPGPGVNSILVVFTSTTLPSDYTGSALSLPTDNIEYKLYNEGDCTTDFSVCFSSGPFPPGFGCCTSQKVRHEILIFIHFQVPTFQSIHL
jgi:hypothetical protein